LVSASELETERKMNGHHENGINRATDEEVCVKGREKEKKKRTRFAVSTPSASLLPLFLPSFLTE